jgi:hypothetical protein
VLLVSIQKREIREEIMKEFTFTAWCRFGRGDSGETEVEVELTDEEAERLTSHGTNANIYYGGFSNCKELEDIYKKIYSIAVDQMTEEMRDFGELDEEELNNPDWKVDDSYACGVNFPSEFEDLLTD